MASRLPRANWSVAVWGGGFQDDVQERFRSGDIAIDLHRPVDFQGWWLATDLGRAAFHLLARGTLPTLAGVLAFDIRLPRSPLVWAAFLLAVLLAVTVSFGLRFLVVLTGFWLHDSEGVRAVVLVVAMFFSGMLIMAYNVWKTVVGAKPAEAMIPAPARA